MNKNTIYAVITLLTAFMIAFIAAYFSVSGIGKMFSGAVIAVMVMASVLEGSKFVISSVLNQFWDKLTFLLKTYLISGLIVLMVITSVGIYGFLTSAYKKTSIEYNGVKNEISIITKKKNGFELQLKDVYTELSDIKSDINEKNNTLKLLNNSEITISNYETKRRTNQTNTDITKMSERRDLLDKKKEYLSDTINKLETLIIETESKSESVAELGPLMYLADITGKPMDTIVNWLCLLLVFVFDPLSICLFIVFNMITKKTSKNEEDDTIAIEPEIVKDNKEISEIVEEKIEDFEEEVEETKEELIEKLQDIKVKLMKIKDKETSDENNKG